MEVLVGIVLFVMLGVIVSQSVISSLGSSRKVSASSLVRDNLNFAADGVVRNMRNARTVTSACTGSASNTVSFTKMDGTTDSYTCVATGGGYLAKGSSLSRLTSDDIILTSCSITCLRPSIALPPVIEIRMSGRLNGSDPLLNSDLDVYRRVSLRSS